ncbi:MAG: BTAD domain-containing putative transcriptional regulator [Myxococcota bacterium]
MRVRIRLLGAFEIDANGERLTLPARKTEALLAVLAVRPGIAYGREWLAALLWPDVPEAQARTSLRQAVGHLRRALGAELIVSSAEKIHLDPSQSWVDSAELERLWARPANQRDALIELWRGPLLLGVAALTQPFDDWLSTERTRIAERAAVRAEECLAAISAHGDSARALELGEHLLTLEPTRESVHRALMKLHAERGDRVAALRQYERCREALSRGLGITPSANLEALRAELLNETPRIASPTPEAKQASELRLLIAVLPFEADSHDHAARSFASALSDDVTTELARFRQLALVSRGTAAALAARNARAASIGRDTGARLVLSGSVRVAGSRVRVTAALTDPTTELELWSERWDAAGDDPTRVLDGVTQRVVAALALRIDEARLGQAREQGRERLQAYDCWLRGLDCLRRGSPACDDEARGYFEQALRLSPRFARAYSGISLSHFNDWSCQAWDRWDERERLSFESARRAVELDAEDHVTQTILARIYVYRREFEQGEHHLRRAIALNPNDADMLMHAALAHAQLGETALACELSSNALRLNPRCPDWYQGIAAFTHLMAERTEEALRFGLSAPDALVDTRALLAVACAKLLRYEESNVHARRFLSNFEQKITAGRRASSAEAVGWLLRVNPFKREDDAAYLLSGLQRAGLDAAARS